MGHKIEIPDDNQDLDEITSAIKDGTDYSFFEDVVPDLIAELKHHRRLYRQKPIAPVTQALMRTQELEEAIRTHRAQKADDRCIEDDDRLYAVLKDGIKCDRQVGDKEAMLKNCQRYIENRCEAGDWLTYAELEAKCQALRIKVAELEIFKSKE